LLSLKNYYAVLAVYDGIMQDPVNRLKQTWDGVKTDVMDEWQIVKNLCSPTNHHEAMRERIRNAISPIVPPLRTPY